MEERRERVLTPSAGAAAYRGRRHAGSRWRRTVAQCHGDSGKREQRMTIRRAKNREYILNDTRIKACLRRFDDNVYTRLEFSESGEPQHGLAQLRSVQRSKNGFRQRLNCHVSWIGNWKDVQVLCYSLRGIFNLQNNKSLYLCIYTT